MSGFIGPIKNICDGIFDGPHATPKESESGPIFLGIKNVTEDGRLDLAQIRHVSEQDFPKWTKRVLPQEDDIVFSYEATLHRYALIPDGFLGCLGRRMALVRPDKNLVIPKFLHLYFLSPSWRALIESNIITGATVDRIPLTKFPEFQIVLPSLFIQQRIADIASSYDDLIENNSRQIQLLEEAARQLYKEWFIRLRFPGHEQITLLDGVPEGWKKTTLGKSITLNYGKALKADHRNEGDYPVYGSSGIVGSHDKYLVNGPGIIVGRKGNVGSVYWSSKNYFPIDTVYFIVSSQSNLYLYYALKNMNFISTDVAVPGLNRDFAYSREILEPSIRVLDDFFTIVTPIHEQIEKLTEMNAKLVSARDLLLPRLMSGEIRV